MTHATSNLDSRRMENGGQGRGDYGAVDLFADPGTVVYAPEDGTAGRSGSAQGGSSLYFFGVSGQEY